MAVDDLFPFSSESFFSLFHHWVLERDQNRSLCHAWASHTACCPSQPLNYRGDKSAHSKHFLKHGLPFPSPGHLPDPGVEPRSPALQADSLLSEPPGKSKNTRVGKPSPSPRDWTGVSCLAGRFFTSWASRETLSHVNIDKWFYVARSICHYLAKAQP